MNRFALLALAAGCGRLAFDPLARTGDGGVPDGPIADGRDPIVGNGLQMWFEFESDELLRDSISNTKASCDGACPTAGTGQRGGGATFQPPACLTFPDAPVFHTDVFTLAAWVRVPATLVSGEVVGKPYNSTSARWNSFELWMFDTMTVRFSTTAGVTNDPMGGGNFAPDTWYHYAAIANGTQKRIIVDGGAMTFTNPTYDLPIAFDAEPIRIGCDKDLGVLIEHLSGEVDDIRFYDRALTVQEIQALATVP